MALTLGKGTDNPAATRGGGLYASQVTDDAPALTDLPEAVRARIVATVAAALPSVVRIPPALRQVAGFAPARRARLGSSAILEALRDDEFRGRVATQVASAAPYDVADPPEALDPALQAALLWLVRPDGWEAALADVIAGVAAEAPPEHHEVQVLRAKIARQEQEIRDLRAAHRAELAEARSENTLLRRRLGEARAAGAEAREAAERAAGELRRGQEAANAAEERQTRETRALRAQIDELTAELGSARRADRSERDQASMRARLLLDAVIEAAAGLRRELGLPAVEGTPGRRIEDALAADTAEAAAGEAVRSSGVLDGLLAMPRSRLIVDGYNVSKQLWPTSPLDAQRARLASALAPLVARTGAETTIVFDAATATSRSPVPTPRGVRVVFSPPGVIADDVIRDLVAAEPEGRVVLVVTDDQELARDVARSGARSVPVGQLGPLIQVR